MTILLVPEAPASIKVVVSGTSSIVVAWAPPVHPRGIMTKYTLFFQVEGERKQKRRTVPSSVSLGMFTGTSFNFLVILPTIEMTTREFFNKKSTKIIRKTV